MTSSGDPSPARAPGGLSPGHVGLVALYHVRFSLRTGGGLVFLLLLLIVGMGLAAAVIAPIESASLQSRSEMTPKDLAREFLESDGVRSAVGWITGSDEEEAGYLLHERPALLSAILILFLFAVPYLASIAAFNQTAGDIGSGGLRYLLLRTGRTNVFLGRFLGSLTFVAASAAFLLVVVVAYLHLKLRIYPGADLWGWGLQGFLAMMLLFLPHLAICALVSGQLRSAFGSLVFCLVATLLPVLFLKIVQFALRANDLARADWLLRLLPWGWKFDLLASGWGPRLLAAGVLLGFTTLFLGAGLMLFLRRDL